MGVLIIWPIKKNPNTDSIFCSTKNESKQVACSSKANNIIPSKFYNSEISRNVIMVANGKTFASFVPIALWGPWITWI